MSFRNRFYRYLLKAFSSSLISDFLVMVILIVVGALGTAPKKLERRLEQLEIRGRMETFLITALLRSPRILRRVLENEKICCHSNSSQSPPANTGVKTHKGVEEEEKY